MRDKDTVYQQRQRKREANRRIMKGFMNGFRDNKKPRGESKEAQELHCHACNRYVQFVIDLSMEGRHVLKCPNCGHEHYRIVQNGRITAERWGQDPAQMQTYYIGGATSTATSMDSQSSSWGTWASSSAGSATYYYGSGGASGYTTYNTN